ncbi:hypothetical protein A33M_0725 [Rhodovulum sp. PH10]|uniref:DUF1007 family protein n=1 Tax=Rhodovulum sp. PH10 TaxID=1187851 RepID=UPI00027C2D5C|nr:DUF1007 family protein [Rhodovulum sp. PH10]EJW09959.1 hypothetical protein A33M_0725 [Rhodovulum sp. PH10]
MTSCSTARLRGLLAVLVLAACTLLAPPARAHPHVWVVMKNALVVAPDGTVTGVRNAWTFDDMFSTYATQGIPSKTPGAFTRDDLKDLAEVNVTSLKEFDFFTYAKLDGKTASFTDPVDAWLEFHDSRLTLHFTLPLKTPVKARTIDLEVYDPTYFVDFSFAEETPFTLAGAPAACTVSVHKPDDAALTKKIQRMTEAQFAEEMSNVGELFGNKVMVRCP